MIGAFLLFSFFTLVLPVEGLEVDIPKKDLPMGVKRITEYKIDQKNKKIPISSIYYNRQGRNREEYIYDTNGTLLWIVIYTYNDAGYLEEKEAVDNEKNPGWRIVYTYDSAGRLQREIQYDRYGNPNYTLVNEYQDDRTETLMYDSEGSILWRRKTIDDTTRGVSETFYYYPDGTRIKGIIKEYNERNQLYKELHIDEIGAIFRRIETEFDEQGRVAERTVFDHRGEIHRWVKIEYLPNGHVDILRQGFPQQNREEIFSYNYEFDGKETWIWKEKIVTVADNKDEQKQRISHKREYREIEYYNYRIGEE